MNSNNYYRIPPTKDPKIHPKDNSKDRKDEQ